MFGLPKETNLDFLVGCELQQLAFSRYQLIMRFSNGIEISVESRLEFKSPNNSANAIWEPGRLSDLPTFGGLFGSKITKYHVPGDGSLQLYFGGGQMVTVYDSNPNHESYQITTKGKSVIV